MPDAAHTLTRYTEPIEVANRTSKIYVFDSSTGEFVGELTSEVADAFRSHTPIHMTYDGQSVTVDPRKDH